MTSTEAFQLALSEIGPKYGAGAKLAKLLGVSRSCVYDIKSGRRRVPAKHVKKVVELSNGKVKAEELRPDLY